MLTTPQFKTFEKGFNHYFHPKFLSFGDFLPLLGAENVQYAGYLDNLILVNVPDLGVCFSVKVFR